WHRDNVLVLIGLLVVGATLALKVTAGRPTLPYFLPTAAIAILLTILLDASTATIVIAIVAIIGGAVNSGPLEVCDLHLPGRTERRLARVRYLHLPGRHGRDRGRPQGRSVAGLRPGIARRAGGERPRGH